MTQKRYILRTKDGLYIDVNNNISAGVATNARPFSAKKYAEKFRKKKSLYNFEIIMIEE